MPWSIDVLNQHPADPKNNEDASTWTETKDPFHLFHEWLEKAAASEQNDPNAMALATVDAEGLPDVRMRSEEHTSELQSLMRTSYAVFCLTPTITDIRFTV